MAKAAKTSTEASQEENVLPITIRTGPESKYSPEACEAVVEAARCGEHVAGMILAAGARSRTTFYEWQEKYPEFKEACEYAKLVSLAYGEKVGLLGTLGRIKGFNATSWAMTMNNKFKDEYNRSGTGNTEINVTNNTLNLSDKEIIQQIEQKYKNLKSLGLDLGGHVIEHGKTEE